MRLLIIIILLNVFISCEERPEITLLINNKILPKGDIFRFAFNNKNYWELILRKEGTDELIPLLKAENFKLIPIYNVVFSQSNKKCATYKSTRKGLYIFSIDFEKQEVEKYFFEKLLITLHEIWFLSEDEIIFNAVNIKSSRKLSSKQIYLLDLNSGKISNISSSHFDNENILDVFPSRREFIYYSSKKQKIFTVKIDKDEKVIKEVINPFMSNIVSGSVYSPDGNKIFIRLGNCVFDLKKNKLIKLKNFSSSDFTIRWYDEKRLILQKCVSGYKNIEFYLLNIEDFKLISYPLEDFLEISGNWRICFIKKIK